MTQALPAFVLSRRRALGLLALAPAVLVLPAGDSASAGHAARLRRGLAGILLPFAPARLDLIGFSQGTSEGRCRMAAVVRMTWAPGLRQRRFVTEAADPERAVAALLDAVRARFSTAA